MTFEQKLIDRIKSAFKFNQDQAEQLAFITVSHKANLKGSVYQRWTKEQATRLAGHLWGLGKAYGEIEDLGRAKVFTKASRSLYEAIENGNADVCSLEGVSCLPYVGDKIRMEFVEFWVAAQENRPTPRQEELMEQAPTYKSRTQMPKW
jgi:hypothetical protein